HFPTAGQRSYVALHSIVSEAEPMQDFPGSTFERVSTSVLVLFLDFTESREDLFHVTGSRRIGHRVLQRFEFVMQISESAAARDGFIQHGPARHFFHVLSEVADGQFLRDRYFALARSFFADNHAEQCGFSGAIRTDQADLLTGVELERSIDEENLPSVLFT